MRNQNTSKSSGTGRFLYVRVSGEEQKIKGLSIEAQKERLVHTAKERGWIIAGLFVDAAKTARKNMHKRSKISEDA